MDIFLIMATKDTGEQVFWGIDQYSGGYPYWAGFSGAQFFKTKEEAEAILKDSSLTDKGSEMSNGSICLPYMIRSAAGLCNKKPKGSFKLEVVKVKFDVISSKKIEVESVKITKSKLVNYEIFKEIIK